MAKILMIIAPKNFRDEELLHTREELEKAGHTVTVASKGTKSASGMLGAEVLVDKDISETKAADYDAVIFVGGTGAAQYFNDETAQLLAKDAATQGKVLGAICIAPSILANAGLLEGKRATAFPSEESNLTAKGAEYTGEDVTIDGKLITAKGPQAAREFGKAIVKALG